MDNSLSFSLDDGVATLAITRPAASNSIDISIIRAMQHALDKVQKTHSGARAVVITGSHGVFCSGLDLHSVDLRTLEARQHAHFEMRRLMDPLVMGLSSHRLPIVAAVNGPAVGAGMSLALACDIIVVADSAYFSPSFTRLGLVPDAGITHTLARRIGGGRSLSALMLAEKIPSKKALDWGLAYETAPDAELLGVAQGVARRLANGPTAILTQIRSLSTSTFEETLQEQLRRERKAQETTLGTRECVEGVRAFFEKRDPKFSDL